VPEGQLTALMPSATRRKYGFSRFMSLRGAGVVTAYLPPTRRTARSACRRHPARRQPVPRSSVGRSAGRSRRWARRATTISFGSITGIPPPDIASAESTDCRRPLSGLSDLRGDSAVVGVLVLAGRLQGADRSGRCSVACRNCRPSGGQRQRVRWFGGPAWWMVATRVGGRSRRRVVIPSGYRCGPPGAERRSRPTGWRGGYRLQSGFRSAIGRRGQDGGLPHAGQVEQVSHGA